MSIYFPVLSYLLNYLAVKMYINLGHNLFFLDSKDKDLEILTKLLAPVFNPLLLQMFDGRYN